MLQRAGFAVAALLIGAGCGGGADEPEFATADLRRVMTVRPVTPGLDWPAKRQERAYTRAELGPADTHPLQATLTGRLEDAGFVRSEESTWHDGTKKGSSFANLFESASGAHDVMPAYREFARRWQSEVEGAEVADVAVAGLGEESWAIRQRPSYEGGPTSVTIDWRRGNLVLEVHVICADPCPAETAARAWADAIDAEARAGS